MGTVTTGSLNPWLYVGMYAEVDFHVVCLSVHFNCHVLNTLHDYLHVLKNETILRMCFFYFHKICYVSIYLTIFLFTLSIPVWMVHVHLLQCNI